MGTVSVADAKVVFDAADVSEVVDCHPAWVIELYCLYGLLPAQKLALFAIQFYVQAVCRADWVLQEPQV